MILSILLASCAIQLNQLDGIEPSSVFFFLKERNSKIECPTQDVADA